MARADSICFSFHAWTTRNDSGKIRARYNASEGPAVLYMHTKLPVALEREPLIEAAFEVRLADSQPLADILPGYLLGALEPKPTITRLPAADIPRPMRATEPGLQFAPTQRLDWGNYLISIGDRNIVISCKLPYPKWANFRASILKILGKIGEVGIEGKVERYSLKYVNVIEGASVAEQLNKIRLNVQLGEISVKNDHFSLNLHCQDNDVVHIISVITNAHAQLIDGRVIDGVVLDVDSIRDAGLPSFDAFLAQVEGGVESMRQLNKAKFFGCLTEEAIEMMGPRYE